MFRDRIDAGERLAETLCSLDAFDAATTVVLGIPRGGVAVARVVAVRLGCPLDVVVPRKLGAPGNAELAIGAVAIDGTTVLHDDLVSALGVSAGYIRAEAGRQRLEIERRLIAYRHVPGERDVIGSCCIVVDDGLATGSTAEAAAVSLRARGASRIALAVPVGSIQGLERLRRVCDEVICLETPRAFVAVGQWYTAFEQVSDEEVVVALRGSTFHSTP